MRIGHLCHLLLWLPLFVAGGCSSAGGQLGTLQTQNRSLLEQNKAQLAEIENLKTHTRRLEDKLIETEQRLESLARREPEEKRVLAATTNQRDLPGDPATRKPDDSSADNRKHILY
jgi:hypothetical protein